MAAYNLGRLAWNEPIVYVHMHGYTLHCGHLPHLLHDPGTNTWGCGEAKGQSFELPKRSSVPKCQELPEPLVYWDVEVNNVQVDGYRPIPWSHQSTNRLRSFHKKRRDIYGPIQGLQVDYRPTFPSCPGNQDHAVGSGGTPGLEGPDL